MAEDFDVEAMLEAPFRKDTYEVNISLTPSTRVEYRAAEDALEPPGINTPVNNLWYTAHYKSIDLDQVLQARSYSKSGRRKSSRRSRTRSRDRKQRSKSRDRKRTSRDKERRRSRSKDRGDNRNSDRGGGGGGGGGNDRNADRDRRRSRDRGDRNSDRKRSNSRSRRSKSKEQNRRSKSPRDRKRRNDRNSRERKPRSKTPPARKRSPSPPSVKLPFPKKARSPIGLGYNRTGSPNEELSPEERDARTVFVMQLSQRIRNRDLEDFFSSVGKVKDVRMITCNKTRRFKGIAYIEFKDPESVALALGLSGQKLLGVPIIVQHTQAEKNRLGNAMPNLMPKGMTGPMRLYVGSLHFNITEEMLRGIFEPFGKIDNIQLIMDPETGRSKGYGFITFHNCDDAKKALEQLNGFELAGRPMKVGNVTERLDLQQQGPSLLDSDELDRSGIDLGATGRLQLMFKLAEGAGMTIPQPAANALSMATGQPIVPQAQPTATPPIATQCFMLSNMFDPSSESNPTWDIEIRDDVIDECNKHGGVLHVYVDKGSPQGNVYVKCPSIATAVASVNTLHGRWFAGRVITAAYVPLINYHSLFPDAMTTTQLLLPTRK